MRGTTIGEMEANHEGVEVQKAVEALSEHVKRPTSGIHKT